jgi:hypothetical protein
VALVVPPDTPRNEKIGLWRDALAVVDQHDLRIRGLHRLAALGAWPFPELDRAIESGDLDDLSAELLSARNLAGRGDVQGAIVRLRQHTASSAAAVELLVEILEEDGQHQEALRETERGIERFGDIGFDRLAVRLLAASGNRDQAADHAIRLLRDKISPPSSAWRYTAASSQPPTCVATGPLSSSAAASRWESFPAITA